MVEVKTCPDCQAPMYWSECNQDWECSNCSTVLKDAKDDYEDVYEPIGPQLYCKICGNPMWPDCIDSCNK